MSGAELDPREVTVLDEAAHVVDGDRRQDYGHPRDNHSATARAWTAYLTRRGLLQMGTELNARDVCWLNVFQKGIRDANRPKRDNLVDACGWARNAEIVGVAGGA